MRRLGDAYPPHGGAPLAFGHYSDTLCGQALVRKSAAHWLPWHVHPSTLQRSWSPLVLLLKPLLPIFHLSFITLLTMGEKPSPILERPCRCSSGPGTEGVLLVLPWALPCVREFCMQQSGEGVRRFAGATLNHNVGGSGALLVPLLLIMCMQMFRSRRMAVCEKK